MDVRYDVRMRNHFEQKHEREVYRPSFERLTAEAARLDLDDTVTIALIAEDTVHVASIRRTTPTMVWNDWTEVSVDSPCLYQAVFNPGVDSPEAIVESFRRMVLAPPLH